MAVTTIPFIIADRVQNLPFSPNAIMAAHVINLLAWRVLHGFHGADNPSSSGYLSRSSSFGFRSDLVLKFILLTTAGRNYPSGGGKRLGHQRYRLRKVPLEKIFKGTFPFCWGLSFFESFK